VIPLREMFFTSLRKLLLAGSNAITLPDFLQAWKQLGNMPDICSDIDKYFPFVELIFDKPDTCQIEMSKEKNMLLDPFIQVQFHFQVLIIIAHKCDTFEEVQRLKYPEYDAIIPFPDEAACKEIPEYFSQKQSHEEMYSNVSNVLKCNQMLQMTLK